MRLIVGLGNPGKKYENTRHNLGYEVINVLKQKAVVSSQSAALYRPSSFMNLSGIEVRKKLNSMRLKPENLIVICDDLDLPLGEVRFKEKGGSAGHRGAQSIIDELETENFGRIRLGIGRPANGKDAEKYVLEEFSKDEEEIVSKMIDKAIEIVINLIENKNPLRRTLFSNKV